MKAAQKNNPGTAEHGRNMQQFCAKKYTMHKMCENTYEYTMYIYIIFKIGSRIIA